jgi:CheY-like chemotaxis protein
VPRSVPGAKQILIVEDDESIRESLAEMLTQDGYHVVTAGDGRAALEQLRWGLRPCLILLDLRMAVMTGWEFRVEQKRDPAIADIPVVAMTTGRWKPDDLTAFSEQLAKPIDMPALRAVVIRYCKTSRALERRETKRVT